MRTSKYGEEQIIGFPGQAEVGMPIKDIGRKHGFSDASSYKWRAKASRWAVVTGHCGDDGRGWFHTSSCYASNKLASAVRIEATTLCASLQQGQFCVPTCAKGALWGECGD